MTIDEAIKQLEFDMAMCEFNPSTGKDDFGNNIENRRTYEADKIAIECMRAYKWYRSQDLIPRDSALAVVLSVGGEYYNLIGIKNNPAVNRFDKAMMKIAKIPKAEPPKDNEVVMKPIDGDCETCDYFDTDYCENYCGYRKAEERLLDGVANGDCETCKHYSTGDKE